MADDDVSISSYVPREGDEHTFDEADWERLQELHSVVAESADVSPSKSQAIRNALVVYLGLLEAHASQGELDNLPAGHGLLAWSRQIALDSLREPPTDDA